MEKNYNTILVEINEIIKENNDEKTPTPLIAAVAKEQIQAIETTLPAELRQEETQTRETDEAGQPEKLVRKRRRFPVGNVLFYGVLIAAVLTAYFSGSTSGNQPCTLFGYSIFTVLSESMQSEIPKGSLVITKYTDPNEIKVGDDVTYLREDLSTITHRVVEIHENYSDSGVRGFRTKGVNNKRVDNDIVHSDNILGVVVFHVDGVGAVLEYIGQNAILFVLIGIILIALVYTLRYLRRNRKDKPEKAKQKAQPTTV